MSHQHKSNDTSAVERMIKAAIDGGWGKANDYRPDIKSYFDFMSFYGAIGIYQALLDPTFWQCAGKSLGWTWGDGYTEPVEANWQFHWHRFIDHLADGHDINSALEKIV